MKIANKKTKKLAALVLAASIMATAVPMQTNCGCLNLCGLFRRTQPTVTQTLGKFLKSKYGIRTLAYSLLIGGAFSSFYKRDRKIKTGPKSYFPFYFNNLGSTLLSITENSLFFVFPLAALIMGKRRTKRITKYIQDKVDGWFPEDPEDSQE
ncbi:hypothetical protein ACFLYU_01620 [Candidatus Dependentiae bacterium]